MGVGGRPSRREYLTFSRGGQATATWTWTTFRGIASYSSDLRHGSPRRFSHGPANLASASLLVCGSEFRGQTHGLGLT